VGTCIAVAIAVFFLLQACFSSWRLASVYFVLLFIPLGGAALAAFLVRDAISVLSLIGAIAALTFAARGGILLINAYQRLEEDGARLGPDLVLQGAQQRFGALVLSTAAAALTLVPLLGHGVVAGLEIVTPMAAVMLGGLLGGALLNLLVVPVLYLRFARPRSESSHARLDLTPQAV
jgi:Cu/Ag efflux pump CusA